MPGVSLTEFKGKKILYEDFSGCKPDTIGPYIEKAGQIIRQQAKGSVLALVNLTGTRFDQALVDRFQSFVERNAPFVRCSAIFGMGAFHAVVYRCVVASTGRANLKVFQSEEEAKDFLAGL